jgi:hypothetical protein
MKKLILNLNELLTSKQDDSSGFLNLNPAKIFEHISINCRKLLISSVDPLVSGIPFLTSPKWLDTMKNLFSFENVILQRPFEFC